MKARVKEALVAGSIVLSAWVYLFDVASNVVVVVEYTSRYVHARNRDTCDITCRSQNSYLGGYLIALFAILAFSHIFNALLFSLKYTQHHAPCFAAYFLPLIQFWDLCSLLWRTLTSNLRIQDLRSLEMNGLYSILGTALEGVPMLNIQFDAYLTLTRLGVFVHGMPTTFKVSVVAALISAAYNGGASVQSVARNTMNLKEDVTVGVIAAGFTLSATMLRSLTQLNILVYIADHLFNSRWKGQDHDEFTTSDLMFVLVCVCTTAAYWLYYWILHSPTNFFQNLRDLRHMMASLAFAYMSLVMGPLYPMVRLANETKQLGQCIFRVRLCMLALLNLILDLTFLFITFSLGTLPKPYFIVSLVAAISYLVFLFAYIKFDAFCGPMESYMQDVEPYESMQHVNQKKLAVQPNQTEPAQMC